jgi:c-di-AMP phosphodiesterase-like protein
MNFDTSISGLKHTVSLGVGQGPVVISDLMEFSKQALSQAQSRGGNQIAVVSLNKMPMYFGAKTESRGTTSRVKLRQFTDNLVNRIKSKSIDNVIIYGHSNADIDAIGGAIGLYDLVKKFGKEVYIQNSTFDNSTKKIIDKYFKNDYSKFFISPSKANKISNKKTLVIIVDTSSPERTDNKNSILNVLDKNIFVVDHHRVLQLNSRFSKDNVYIDTLASSSSEIVVDILQFGIPNARLKEATAQVLLTGIYLDTKSFQRSTSTNTFNAAGWLETFGAKPTIAINHLKISEKDSQIVAKIIKNSIEVKPGFYLCTSEIEAPVDIISVAADELLRIEGHEAAFVISKIPGKKMLKLSARSLDHNVQIIAEMVGGGGHFGVAAATSEESLEIFKDNLIQAIVSVKNENNNN